MFQDDGSGKELGDGHADLGDYAPLKERLGP